MRIVSYSDIPKSVLTERHTTSAGETYTLDHNSDLVVEMPYLGKNNSNSNSQGWERNSVKYFQTIYEKHPEMFSAKNTRRVLIDKTAPIVDWKMVLYHPEWAEYMGQVLIHHHIGGDGEAVAIPQNAHKGYGEIHNAEKAAGIRDNCKQFSEKCSRLDGSVGKTASQLRAELEQQEKLSENNQKNRGTLFDPPETGKKVENQAQGNPQKQAEKPNTKTKDGETREGFAVKQANYQGQMPPSIREKHQGPNGFLPQMQDQTALTNVQSAKESTTDETNQKTNNQTNKLSPNLHPSYGMPNKAANSSDKGILREKNAAAGMPNENPARSADNRRSEDANDSLLNQTPEHKLSLKRLPGSGQKM